MTPARKLAIVAALQFLVLLSIVGFKQYTIWTSETVLLKVEPIDPRRLRYGSITVEYEISRIDSASIPWDEQAGRCCDIEVYVELERQDDGYWKAIAAHGRRTHTRDGTVLIKGNAQGHDFDNPPQTVTIRYGIERLVFAEGSIDQVPVAVEVRVDRFGNATACRLVVGGQRVKLKGC